MSVPTWHGTTDRLTPVENQALGFNIRRSPLLLAWARQEPRCCRWLVAQKDPVRNGEMYRMIADTGGAFVQPALYEAFGLTVVEVCHHAYIKCNLHDLHGLL